MINSYYLFIIIFILIMLITLYNVKKIYYIHNSSNHINKLYSLIKDRSLNIKNKKLILSFKNSYIYKLYDYINLKSYIFVSFKYNYLITNKKNLWTTLLNFYGYYKTLYITPLTYIFPSDYEKYKNNEYNNLIIFKTLSHNQNGLFVTNNIQSLKFINDEKFILAQKYLTNSFKYKNKNTTFRIYTIIEFKNNIFSVYYFNDGLIYYSNKNEYISSFTSSKHIYSSKYPILLSNFKYTKYFIDNLIHKIKLIFTAFIYFYPKSKLRSTYYELYGIDFNVLHNFDTKIIEINAGPGMEHHNYTDFKLRNKLLNNYINLIFNIQKNTNELIKII